MQITINIPDGVVAEIGEAFDKQRPGRTNETIQQWTKKQIGQLVIGVLRSHRVMLAQETAAANIGSDPSIT